VKKIEMTTVKETFLGCTAVLVSNTCLLANSYIAKHQAVAPGQILTTRSVPQIVLFGLWALYQRFKKSKDDEASEKIDMTVCTWLIVLLANSLLSISQIICYAAVKMIPLSDFVVLCFTSPVFALVCTAIILKRQCFSVMEAVLCLTIVAGATLVAQPSFIFGQVPRSDSYLLGSMLSLSVAAMVGLFTVLSAKCKQVPIGIFMTAGGATSLVLGLGYCIVVQKDMTPSLEEVKFLCLMAFLSMCGILHLRLAALFISPVLVSMVRTFEIVMGLVLEICVSLHSTDFGSLSFAYKVTGCAVVTASAILMAMSEKMGACCNRKHKVAPDDERTPIRSG